MNICAVTCVGGQFPIIIFSFFRVNSCGEMISFCLEVLPEASLPVPSKIATQQQPTYFASILGNVYLPKCQFVIDICSYANRL